MLVRDAIKQLESLSPDEEIVFVAVAEKDKDTQENIGKRIGWSEVVTEAQVSARSRVIYQVERADISLAEKAGERPHALFLYEKGNEYHLHNKYCNHRTYGMKKAGDFANAQEAEAFWNKEVLSMKPIIRGCVPKFLIRDVVAKIVV